MKIEIWSDTVCPWCYVGLKRLQQALGMRPAVVADIRWMPFELNPDLPDAGMDRREYLMQKFGDPDRFKDMQGAMQQLTGSLGIDYRPERQTRMPSTRKSHMLIQAAAEFGKQTAVKEAILRAYFSEGLDIGDARVLMELVEPLGFEPARVARLLEDDALRALVEQQESEARRMQISGVPTFVFDRKLGFSGAQEVAVFLQALDRVASAA